MPTKTRPVEKIAKAAAQCSVEVCLVVNSMQSKLIAVPPGCGVWQMRSLGLQLRSQGYVRQGVHETEELLPCKSIQLRLLTIHIVNNPTQAASKKG